MRIETDRLLLRPLEEVDLDAVAAIAADAETMRFLAGSAWGQGYATEAARAVRDHGRDVLGFERLVSLVHPQNRASQRVAEKLGMARERTVTIRGARVELWACCYSA